jgi:hypothetical protein
MSTDEIGIQNRRTQYLFIRADPWLTRILKGRFPAELEPSGEAAILPRHAGATARS